jgi:hypothetical protein
MGVDGSGIFDNDTAGDFLSATCRHLHEVIRNDLDTLHTSFERTTPAAVSVLLGIAKHIPLMQYFIEPEEITEFRDRYLQWFDANMHESEATPEFLQEERDIVEQEFNALIVICSKT